MAEVPVVGGLDMVEEGFVGRERLGAPPIADDASARRHPHQLHLQRL